MQCEYCEHLKSVDEYRLIHNGQFWQVALSPDQQYLGKTFVTLKRHAESLKELEAGEGTELLEIIKRFETSLSIAFTPTHFNWSCLMNNSAGSGHPFHVHWHAIPRYKESHNVGGIEFTDQRWPGSARDMEPNKPNSDVLAKIREAILENF